MLRGLMQLTVIVILYLIYLDGTVERVDELTDDELLAVRRRWMETRIRPPITHTAEDVLSLYGDDDDATLT